MIATCGADVDEICSVYKKILFDEYIIQTDLSLN